MMVVVLHVVSSSPGLGNFFKNFFSLFSFKSNKNIVSEKSFFVNFQKKQEKKNLKKKIAQSRTRPHDIHHHYHQEIQRPRQRGHDALLINNWAYNFL